MFTGKRLKTWWAMVANGNNKECFQGTGCQSRSVVSLVCDIGNSIIAQDCSKSNAS